MARGFCSLFGSKKVRELKPYDLDNWLVKQDNWNPTSKAHAVALILAAISWAKKKGYTHKTAKKTQRDRIIFLTPEAQAFTEECIKKYRDGPIYRTYRGAKWVQTNCTNKWRGWLLSRPKVVAHLAEHKIDPKT